MFELLDEPAYRHVLLNHLPITGLAVACLSLVFALVLRQRSAILAALALVVLTAGSVLPVVAAGEDAYRSAYDALNGDGRAWLDHHTYLADLWVPLLYADTALALFAMGLGVWRPKWLPAAARSVLLGTLASLGAAAVIGESGGKIQHPEFRLSDPPVHESSGRLRAPQGRG